MLRLLLRSVTARRRRPGPLRTVDSDVVALAQQSAIDGYEGPREEEPYVSLQLQVLRATMASVFRTSTALRGAQAAELSARRGVTAAEEEELRVRSETKAMVAAGERTGHDPSEPAQIARVTASVAQQRRDKVVEAVTAATNAHLQALNALQAAEEAVIDELGITAEQALPAINSYLAIFDQQRLYVGRPGLGQLDNNVVQRLVRETLRSLTADSGNPPADPNNAHES